jgi:hypothetical protein
MSVNNASMMISHRSSGLRSRPPGPQRFVPSTQMWLSGRVMMLRKLMKSDGTTWDREVLVKEFKRQLDDQLMVLVRIVRDNVIKDHS